MQLNIIHQKRFLSCIVSFLFLSSSICLAQITANSPHTMGRPPMASDIDTIIVFEDLNTASITITSKDTCNFVWNYFTFDGSTYITEDSVLVDLDTTSSKHRSLKEGAYHITYTQAGEKVSKNIWVFDYAQHTSISIQSLYVNDTGNPEQADAFDPCSIARIELELLQDSFFYFNSPSALNNEALQLINQVIYPKLSGTTTVINDNTLELSAPSEEIKFELTLGERFVFANNTVSKHIFGETTYTSDEYSPIALGTLTITADFPSTASNTNELDKYTQSGNYHFVSVPADIYFSSDAPAHADFYTWTLKKAGANPHLITNYEGPEFLFSFRQADTFMISLTASNEYCSSTDSITIITYPSLIHVPNTFTPNGDGINDEFKVAYRSIKSFEATIFSRWGKSIYSWTDPAKGWNGQIGGRKASPGVYYYVIKATGTDSGKNIPISLQGEINLVRE